MEADTSSSSPMKDTILDHGVHSSSLSTPTSPSRFAELYNFAIETADEVEEEEDEEFAFTSMSISVSTADELFDDGKIKASKPLHGPRSPLPKSPAKKSSPNRAPRDHMSDRGRDRAYVATRCTSRKGSRSLSPHRASGSPWDGGLEKQTPKRSVISSPVESNCSISYSKSATKKWSLRDLLLFRSASEGRSTDWDPFRKYSAAALFKTKKSTNYNQEPKSSSFRSTEDSVRKRVPMSAHEAHYTVNKALSAHMKKKTFLPYKYGFLGRLAFNPAIQAPFNNSN